tara:strand:+ start:2830 stop:3804 length:975 start_codon:yes stop_codon:yes gene_type:complete
MDNVSNNTNNFLSGIKKNIVSITPYGTENFLNSTNSFFGSNTMIAKATFLLLVLIIFVFLFYIFSKILFYFLSPSETPYIVKGMKDATQSLIIPQSTSDKSAIPIYRSKNEYDGVEFTYSCWIYVNDVNYNENTDFKHVFHKGSTNSSEDAYDGVYGPNNAPGVYLYNGKKNISDNLLDKYPLLGMLVRLNIYHNTDDKHEPYKYYEDIFVDGIPIKKWVNVIIRVTTQNIVDIYINGTLTKRHQLSNIVKQNYDNIYVNMNGGFSGNLSNLKYYNYAISIFEITGINAGGPDLTISKDSNIKKAKPYYLSSQWYFDDTDPLTN